MSSEPKLSLVIPFFNECDNVEPLHAEIESAMQTLDAPWEAVYVDDGSTDGTCDRLLAARESDPTHVNVIRLTSQFAICDGRRRERNRSLRFFRQPLTTSYPRSNSSSSRGMSAGSFCRSPSSVTITSPRA